MITPLRRAAAALCIATIALFAALLSSPAQAADENITPSRSISVTGIGSAGLFQITVTPEGGIWVPTNIDGHIFYYPPGSTGAATPTLSLTAANADAVAIGPDGAVYSVDGYDHRIDRFTSTGTFVNSLNLSYSPRSAGLDASGKLYVVDSDGVVRVYAAGAQGSDAALYSNQAASLTSVVDAHGITVLADGSYWVALGDNHGSTPIGIAYFPAGAQGTTEPTTLISGSNTTVNSDRPIQVAVGPTGKLAVAPLSYSVPIFAKDATGNATPERNITGSNTLMQGTGGAGFDAAGNLYVANNQTKVITVYAGIDPKPASPSLPNTGQSPREVGGIAITAGVLLVLGAGAYGLTLWLRRRN